MLIAIQEALCFLYCLPAESHTYYYYYLLINYY